MSNTGFPDADAGFDFERQRRRRAFSRLSARLRSEPDDVSEILPFDEVVAALGRRGERDLGRQLIALDSVVGTVDREREGFDREFRPTTAAVRNRWERIAAARHRGAAMPPIDVYRVGDLHFVKDGHHRVSVARAMKDTEIEANVTEVLTRTPAGADLMPHDLPVKAHERVFLERAPLPEEARARVVFTDEWRYAELASLIESWGFRASHARGELLSREEVAERWYREEYLPVVEVLRETGVGGPGREAEVYLNVAMLRYLLLRTHDWTDEIASRLLGELRPPAKGDDTLVHQILKEMD